MNCIIFLSRKGLSTALIFALDGSFHCVNSHNMLSHLVALVEAFSAKLAAVLATHVNVVEVIKDVAWRG